VQTLAPGRLNKRTLRSEVKGEGAARFENREDTYQPLLNAVTFGQLSRRIFLAHTGGEILIRSLVLFGQGNCVRFHPFGVLQ
jgi:hypothetical protein